MDDRGIGDPDPPLSEGIGGPVHPEGSDGPGASPAAVDGPETTAVGTGSGGADAAATPDSDGEVAGVAEPPPVVAGSEPGGTGPRSRRSRIRSERRWRRTGVVLVVVGVLILAGVGAWQLNATLWSHHSETAGRALVKHFLHNEAMSSPATSPTSLATGTPTTRPPTSSGPATATLASCHGSSTSSTDPVAGLLEIPKLDVIAPVEQGVEDTELNVAVGHLPGSVWPGSAGNSVLEAHDVSYFTGLSALATGDDVDYVTPCTTYEFTVSGATVVSAGSPVYDTPSASITLVTCWPTNALWFTPDRYLVTAVMVGSTPTVAGRHTYLTAVSPPSVAVPAALASQGVTLATYSLPMGTFTLSGTPDTAWAATTNPLLDQGSGVEAYIAAVRALTENRLDWWADLAPGVTAPAPLVGSDNPGYLTSTDVDLEVDGSTPTQVTLTDTVRITGGPAPGTYSQKVTETITTGHLTISGWTLSPG